MRYASRIHWMSAPLAPRSRTMVGSATLRIVLSIVMTTSDTQMTARVYQRRS
jgi:hypothetical protein